MSLIDALSDAVHYFDSGFCVELDARSSIADSRHVVRAELNYPQSNGNKRRHILAKGIVVAARRPERVALSRSCASGIDVANTVTN